MIKNRKKPFNGKDLTKIGFRSETKERREREREREKQRLTMMMQHMEPELPRILKRSILSTGR